MKFIIKDGEEVEPIVEFSLKQGRNGDITLMARSRESAGSCVYNILTLSPDKSIVRHNGVTLPGLPVDRFQKVVID